MYVLNCNMFLIVLIPNYRKNYYDPSLYSVRSKISASNLHDPKITKLFQRIQVNLKKKILFKFTVKF